MINCPHCQHQNPSGSKFCNDCGNSLPLTCPNCGHENPAGSKFCNRCGHRLAYGELSPSDDRHLPATDQGGDARFSSSSLTAPQELVEALESARQSAGQSGERRIVTILFCDIEGSTAAASLFDPEDWTEIINGAFEHMIRPIYNYDGTVARLMGDGLLAFFGAPHAHEDDPERAVLAGLDIVQSMKAYREQVQQRWDIELNLRVGINTGLVTVGEVGSGLRAEYSAMGDAINLAARMEQTAAPGTIQIADPTYRLIAERFEFESLGRIAIKGKEEPVAAYRVLGRRDRSGTPRHPSQLKAALVGREEEMVVLEQVLAGLQNGRGRVVCLLGEVGLGKSRLIEELYGRWLTGAPDPGLVKDRWLTCYGISYEMERPYGVIQQLVRQILGMTADTPLAAAHERLASTARELGDQDIDWFVTVLEILLGLEPQDPEVILEGEALRTALFAAVSGLVESWRAGQPAVLIFDDLHWADSASVDLIKHLMLLVDQAPLAIFCLLRPERQAPSWTFGNFVATNLTGHGDQITLQPLSLSEGTRLADLLLAKSEVTPSLRETVIAKSEGNPFYIQEVARTLLEMGGQEPVPFPGERSAGETVPIPDTVQALLTARIDRLDDESRRVLQLAAVIGRRFILRVLQHIYEPPALLGDQIRKLEQADLIEEIAHSPDKEYQFNQPLIQEAAYRTILRRDRRTFHQKVAEIIEQQFPNRLEEFVTHLAHHFSEAGDLRAATYHRLAGDLAHRLHANAEAATHYRQALALVRADSATSHERLTALFICYGRALELVDQYAEALANYEDMERLANDRKDPSMLLDALVRQALIRSTVNTQFDPQEALTLTDRTLQLAEELGDREAEARIHWNLLNIGRFGGFSLAQGIEHGEQALAIASEIGLKELQAYILNDLADTVGSMGNVHRALPMLKQANIIWRDLDNRPMSADSLSNSATWYSLTGDYALAQEQFDEAFAISKQIHNLWGQAYSRSFSGMIYHDLGQPGEALQAFTEGSRLSDRAGFLVGRIFSRTIGSAVYVDLGAVEFGLKLAREAYALTETLIPQFRPVFAGFVANAWLQNGDLEAAATLMDAVKDLDRTLEVYIRSGFDLVRVKLTLAQGMPERALVLAEEGIAWLREMGIKAYLPDFLGVQAEALQALSRKEEAWRILQEARTIAEEIGNKRSLWSILAQLTKYHQGDAPVKGARSTALAEQAHRVVLAIAAETPDYDPLSGLKLRSQFLNKPAIRELLDEQ